MEKQLREKRLIYWKHAKKVVQSFQGTRSPMPTSYRAMEVNEKESGFQREELKAKEKQWMGCLPREQNGAQSPICGTVYLHSSADLNFKIGMEQ